MKKLIIALLLVLVSIFSSCVHFSTQIHPINDDSSRTFAQYKELITKSIIGRIDYGITISDVEDYLNYRLDISNEKILNINKYEFDPETYCFIVNLKGGGWFILSGDYNSTPILAKGDEGYLIQKEFTLHEINWFNSIKDYMLYNRLNTGLSEQNRTEWLRPQQIKIVNDYNNRLHRDGDNDTSELQVYYSYEIDTLIYANYPALTTTHWNQITPWNNEMPMYGINTRCVAGCAVIAIAQLLYYTHYAFGFPNAIYANANCSDYFYEGPPYDFNLTNYTTSSWDLMTTTGSGSSSYEPYMPALCAMVSKYTNTEYTIDSTLINTLNEPSLGITTNGNIPPALDSFQLTGTIPLILNETTVKNEIAQNRPVLCMGKQSPNSTIGHTYLIHGYYQYKFKEIERVTDAHGFLIEENVHIYEHFYWLINPGAQNGNHIQVSRNTYYPINPVMFVGWTQQ